MQTLIFLVLWGIELLLAVWGLRIAQFFSYRMPKVAARPVPDWSPQVAVILPIKGVESGTGANLEAILNQAYRNYRVIATVESLDDPVCDVIREFQEKLPSGKLALVVAGRATERGQKVQNALRAVAATTEQDEVLAFVDGDANLGPQCLQALVGPLGYGPHIGATTGYRFYIPVNSHPANAIVSISNAIVASLFGPYRRTVAWGGSMAIRRADFYGYGVDAAWNHALSDDFTLSWCVRKKNGVKIHFVPQCLVASTADYSFSRLFEFMTRQFRITRISSWHLWASATAGSALYLLTLFSAFYFAVIGLYLHQWGGAMGSLAVLVVLYVLSILRGLMLLRGGRRLLPNHAAELDRVRWWYALGFPLVQAWILLTLIVAGVGRRMTWRGIRYRMVSPLETEVLAPRE